MHSVLTLLTDDQQTALTDLAERAPRRARRGARPPRRASAGCATSRRAAGRGDAALSPGRGPAARPFEELRIVGSAC